MGGDKNERTLALPLAYLITFTCYGSRLHGDEAGSVDRRNNTPLTPSMPANPRLRQAERETMRQAPYELDENRRQVVLEAIHEACDYRGWALVAAHVRQTHVHMVIHALERAEKLMVDIKALASRRLNEAKLDTVNRKRWARHGSTRYLWKPEAVEAAIHYVIPEQGEPMAVFENPNRSLIPAAGTGSEPAESDPSRQEK